MLVNNKVPYSTIILSIPYSSLGDNLTFLCAFCNSYIMKVSPKNWTDDQIKKASEIRKQFQEGKVKTLAK